MSVADNVYLSENAGRSEAYIVCDMVTDRNCYERSWTCLTTNLVL